MKILINKKTSEILIGSYWHEVLANPTLQPLIEVVEIEAKDSSIDETKINDFKNWKTTFDVEKKELFYNRIIIDQLPIFRQKKLSELQQYDSSSEVNSFTINGIDMWLPKEQRLSIANLANARKNAGQITMELNLNNMFIEFPVEAILQMLTAIEIYAGDCYNVTQKHSATISKLESMEQIEAYDFEKGYPKKLIF